MGRNYCAMPRRLRTEVMPISYRARLRPKPAVCSALNNEPAQQNGCVIGLTSAISSEAGLAMNRSALAFESCGRSIPRLNGHQGASMENAPPSYESIVTLKYLEQHDARSVFCASGGSPMATRSLMDSRGNPINAPAKDVRSGISALITRVEPIDLMR
jgi:hypothetical protein